MKKYIIIVACLLIAGCAGLSQENKELLLKVLQGQVEAGKMTPEQALALAKAMSGSFAGLGELLLGMGGAVITSLTGVRLWRGGIGARKGKVA